MASPDICLSFPPVTPKSRLLTLTPLLSPVSHTLLPGGGAVPALPGPPASLFLVTCNEPGVLRARLALGSVLHTQALIQPLGSPFMGL